MSRQVVYCVGIIIYLYLLLSLLLLTLELKFNLNEVGSVKIGSPFDQVNKTIFFTCSRYKIFYMDVFNVFLDVNGNRNQYLFPKYDSNRKMFDIHPNKRGLGVLARVYIYSIHSKWFNPVGY